MGLFILQTHFGPLTINLKYVSYISGLSVSRLELIYFSYLQNCYIFLLETLGLDIFAHPACSHEASKT